MGVRGKYRGTGAPNRGGPMERLGPSANAERIRRLAGTKSDTVRAGGRDIENDRIAVIRSLANGTAAERETLKMILSSLDDKQKKGLAQAIALEYRNPRTGGVGLTAEGDRLMSILAESGTASPDQVPVNAAGLPDDPVGPSPSRPRPKPAGLDPKTAGVRDPGGESTRLKDEPLLRGPELQVESVPVAGKDGEASETFIVSPKVDGKGKPVGGRLSDKDYAAVKKGEAYERGKGPKPEPLSDIDALATDKSPQQMLDDAVMALINGSMPQGRKGRTATGVYTPPSGSRDHAMEIWELLRLPIMQGEGGAKSLAGPNAAFSSPRQMAEQVVRNMSRELLERPAITPSQADRAKKVLGYESQARRVEGQGPLTNEAAGLLLSKEGGDLPIAKGKRKAFEEQAIERLTREFETRFGDKWGEDYKPSETSIGEEVDADGLTDDGIVESRMPGDLGPGTSQDPSKIPAKPDNVRGRQPAPAPFKHPQSRAEGLPASPEQEALSARVNELRREWAEKVAGWRLDEPVRGPGVEPDEPDVQDWIDYDSLDPRTKKVVDSWVERRLSGEDEAVEKPKPAEPLKRAGEEDRGPRPKQKPLSDAEMKALRAAERSTPENLQKRQATYDRLKEYMPQLDNALADDLETRLESLRETRTRASDAFDRAERFRGIADDLDARIQSAQSSGADDVTLAGLSEQLDRARRLSSDAEAELRSIGDVESLDGEIAKAEQSLAGARRLDGLTFHAKPKGPGKPGTSPLGGRVPKGKGGKKAPESTPPVGDEANAAAGSQIDAADDSSVIDQRPGLIPTGRGTPVSDDSLNFRSMPGDDPDSPDYIPPVDGMGTPDESFVDGYPEPTGLGVGRQPQSFDPGYTPPDPSARQAPEIIDAEFEVKPDEQPGALDTGSPETAQARAADAADNAEAPRDAESDKAAARSREGLDDDVDESGKPTKPQKESLAYTAAAYPFRHPFKTLLGGGLLGLYGALSGRMSTDGSSGFTIDDGRPGAEMMGPDDAGLGGDMASASAGYGAGGDINGGMSPAERIRMLQRVRGHVPTGTPQTLYNWRGN